MKTKTERIRKLIKSEISEKRPVNVQFMWQ